MTSAARLAAPTTHWIAMASTAARRWKSGGESRSSSQRARHSQYCGIQLALVVTGEAEAQELLIVAGFAAAEIGRDVARAEREGHAVARCAREPSTRVDFRAGLGPQRHSTGGYFEGKRTAQVPPQ